MTTASLQPASAPRLVGSPSRRRTEAAVRGVLLVAVLVTVAVSAGIVLALIFEAVQFLALINPAQLLDEGWFPRRGMFGLPTLIAGTLIVAGVAMAIAGPIGFLSAIYLAEYASPRVRRVVKPILEILAGIPSVVLGFFALAWINPNVVQTIFPTARTFNMLAAGIGVGILTIPLVASVSEDAMRAVPVSLREASYGLGAHRRTTVLRIVVPAAISGIVAAFILAVSRTVGETMVVAVAAGATGGSLFTVNPLEPGQTVTAAMATLAVGSDQVVGGEAAYLSLFFLGLLLFAVTAGLNLIGDVYVRRVRIRY